MSVVRIRRSRAVLVFGGGLLATAVTAGALKTLPGIGAMTVAITLLLVVVGVATFGRLWMAIAVAVIATLSFQFLFLSPVGTFTIADPQNWVALGTFFVAAIVASNLATAARDWAEEAKRGDPSRWTSMHRHLTIPSNGS